MVNRRQLGNRLANKRKEHGFGQADVSREINVSRTAIAEWETGVKSPSFASIVKLADLYDCSIDELVGRKQ